MPDDERCNAWRGAFLSGKRCLLDRGHEGDHMYEYIPDTFPEEWIENVDPPLENG